MRFFTASCCFDTGQEDKLRRSGKERTKGRILGCSVKTEPLPPAKQWLLPASGTEPSSEVCLFSRCFSFNSVNLDSRLPEESGPEPGREDELRGGEALAPDDQHRPERAVRPLFVQGQARIITPVKITSLSNFVSSHNKRKRLFDYCGGFLPAAPPSLYPR